MSQKSESINHVTLKLDSFEGPLDLLLHLIKDSEMDIYDIQISKITAQYLLIIEQSEKMPLNIIGDYFVMASTLMKIKSQMLLPIEISEVEEEQGDPRANLVDQLIEYQIFKNASDELNARANKRANNFSKEQSKTPENKLDERQFEIPGLDLDALQGAFKRVLEKQIKRQPVEKKITLQSFSLDDKIVKIKQIVANSNGQLVFDDLFEYPTRLNEVVVTFLAILELSKMKQIRLEQVGNHEAIQIIKI